MKDAFLIFLRFGGFPGIHTGAYTEETAYKIVYDIYSSVILSDVALLYATMGHKDRLISGVLENVVFLELKRRGYSVYVGKIDAGEVDFIAEKSGKKLYIQVSYQLNNPSTIDREFGTLLNIKDQFPKYVVTMDDFWKDSMEGVEHWHITDFLLSDVF